VLTVCSFWWTDPAVADRARYQYGPEDVFVHKRMVERHMKQPFRYVCVTDNPKALPGVETVPLEYRTHVPGTRFAKLMLFRKGVGLGEQVLYLDLDCVITGELDPLVKDGSLVLWRNPNFGVPRRAFYNTSIILVKADARPELYNRFDPKRHPAALAVRWGGTDQAWLSEQASPDEAHWTASDGVYGAGRLKDIAPGVGTALPGNARIVFFPGNRQPAGEVAKHPWIKEYRF
jgi:hypothetical protein